MAKDSSSKGVRKPDWAKVAELMVRGKKSLRRVAVELDIPMTTAELDAVEASKDFQRLLEDAKNAYNYEAGADPGKNKISAVGLMYRLADKLMEDGKYDKAADVIQKIAKIEGWDESDKINVFAGLSDKDFLELERQLERKHKDGAKSAGEVGTGEGSSRPN